MVSDDDKDALTVAPSPTDEQLLTDFRHGDRPALAALVERHEVRLARIAYRITGCQHEAEDVRHAVFVRLLQSLQQLGKVQHIGAWLTRCTVNEAITRVRQLARENRALTALALTESDEVSPLEQLQAHEARAQLMLALAKLTPDERALLSLRFDEDLTFREIAEVLERPTSTVKSRVAQAITKLRMLLGASQ